VAEAKQKTSQLLAAYPQVDAVLTQECSAGILQAFAEAGRPMPKAVNGGEAIEDLRAWDKFKATSLMVENPPAVGAHGLMIGVRLIQGKKLDPSRLSGNVLKMKQNLIITNAMRAEWIAKTASMKDTEYIDSLMTDAQIDKLFTK
jgi:ribose transport system substrate-binding protein